MGTGGPGLATGGPGPGTERGAGVAATECLLLLRFLLNAKLLPRCCWCWLCSRFDCKSLRRVRLGDGRGNGRGRGRYGVEEGDSGAKGPVAVAGAGSRRGGIAGMDERVDPTTILCRAQAQSSTCPRCDRNQHGFCCAGTGPACRDRRGSCIWRDDLSTTGEWNRNSGTYDPPFWTSAFG